MRITLNLATRPFTDLGPAIKRLRIGMAALVVLCLLFAVGLHLFDSQAAAARAREHSLDGAIARVEAERRQDEEIMRQPANAQTLMQAEFLNERFDEKAFSWTLAMEALENVLPPGVQVTSIEPQRRKDGHITVELRVVGPHDLSVKLVRQLESSRRFLEPRIESESAESSNNANQQLGPVSATNRFEFELVADYNPPTLEERGSPRNVSLKNALSRNATPRSTSPSSRPQSPPALPLKRGPYSGPVVMPTRPAANGGPQ